MHYKKAIKLPFKDLNKLTIAALFLATTAFASILGQIASLLGSGYESTAVIIGVPLYIIGFILSLFVTGYSLNVGKKAIKKKFVLPAWKNYGELLSQGFVSVFISMVYYFPGLLILIISIVGGALGAVGAGASGLIAAIPGIVISILLLMLAAFISPAAMLAYSEKWQFNAAFNLPRLFKKTFSAQWIAALSVSFAWVFLILIGFILSNIILFFISPLLILVVSPYMSAVISITTYAMLGEAFGEVKVK